MSWGDGKLAFAARKGEANAGHDGLRSDERPHEESTFEGESDEGGRREGNNHVVTCLK